MADYTFTADQELKLHGKDTELFHYWDFGDGTPISNLSNPSHIYSSLGTYTMSHWAQSPCGICAAKTHTIEIVSSLPYSGTAEFGFQLGEEIFFNRKDTELNHYWDFGDGAPITTLSSPTHIYITPGIYTMSHWAQSPCGTCTTITRTIEILSPPIGCPTPPVCNFVIT